MRKKFPLPPSPKYCSPAPLLPTLPPPTPPPPPPPPPPPATTSSRSSGTSPPWPWPPPSPPPRRPPPSRPLSATLPRPTPSCPPKSGTDSPPPCLLRRVPPLTFALLPFLHRHRLCFPLDLLLSSLLHSLSVSSQLLPYSLLLSFPPSLSDPPSPLLLNSPLAASAAASCPAVALCLLALLRRHSFLPDLASSHLVTSLLNTRDPSDAALLVHLLADLRESRLEPDAPLFTRTASHVFQVRIPQFDVHVKLYIKINLSNFILPISCFSLLEFLNLMFM